MKFINNKYAKIYSSIIEKRRGSPPCGYSEKHHIIPISLGGKNKKNNIVRLSAREHYICHLLLVKMVERGSVAHKKMCVAWGLMYWCESPNQNRLFKVSNSKLYEALRKDHAEAMKYLQSGKRNSQHGKMWIHNCNLKENKKIKKGRIPKGWEKGRVLNWEKYEDKKLREKENPIVQKKCFGCNATFKARLLDCRKLYCSKVCCQRQAYKVTRKVQEIKRGDERKLIRPQDVSSYKKYGWQISD